MITQILLEFTFNLFHLFFSGGHVGGDEIVEEFIDVADVASHTVLHHVVSVGLMAQELCQFTTQIDQALADLEVVLRIVVDALRILGHIHLLAQVATRAVSHKGRV